MIIRKTLILTILILGVVYVNFSMNKPVQEIQVLLQSHKPVTCTEISKSLVLCGVRDGGVLLVQEVEKELDPDLVNEFVMVEPGAKGLNEFECVPMDQYYATHQKPLIELKIRGVFVPGVQLNDLNAQHCAELIRKYVLGCLTEADVIVLKNVEKSDDCHWLADVICNGENLGGKLVKNEYADPLDSAANSLIQWEKTRVARILKELEKK